METEFQNAYGKGVGEVLRDIADFLSTPVVLEVGKKKIDLCSLLENLNMHEQFSFALLCEAEAQGWDADAAEAFYRQAVSGVVNKKTVDAIVLAFRNRESDAFRSLEARYGSRFRALDGSYWSTVLAVGIDAGQVGEVMRYLRAFTVTLMEFAYMEDRNPDATYTWCYYDSFRLMLDELTADPAPAPMPLKVRALGGTVGKRTGDGYVLSLGIDVENPNEGLMARAVALDITLKDRDGRVITVIADRLQSLDPGAIYHYGITRRIRGAAVASFSAVARPESYLNLDTPIMKHCTLSKLSLKKTDAGVCLGATLKSNYDRPLRAPMLHYQFLSADNKILGGGSEWLSRGVPAGGELTVSAEVNVPITGASKLLYSLDFDALELIGE
ncbi:MAG: hypothetical protein IJW29_01435 [Clostridia bacterium]|nr:hypothetical protein [Clostridia bacterium]